jgi:hypothetical protein
MTNKTRLLEFIKAWNGHHFTQASSGFWAKWSDVAYREMYSVKLLFLRNADINRAISFTLLVVYIGERVETSRLTR